jgi:hypothetical protein
MVREDHIPKDLLLGLGVLLGCNKKKQTIDIFPNNLEESRGIMMSENANL